MKKEMKKYVFILALFLLSVVSVKAEAFNEEASGPLFTEENTKTTEKVGSPEWKEKIVEDFLRGAKNYIPAGGIIQNAETAIKIAEAVVSSVYGPKTVEAERPFQARLKGDVWIVSGTTAGETALGGVAYIKISKQNGAVLLLTHAQ